MAENRTETPEERFSRQQARILEASSEHNSRMQSDPEYRAKCEEIKRTLDEYYSFGTKQSE